MTERWRCKAGGPAEYIHVRPGGRAEVFCADCHEHDDEHDDEPGEPGEQVRCIRVRHYLACGDEIQPAERE